MCRRVSVILEVADFDETLMNILLQVSKCCGKALNKTLMCLDLLIKLSQLVRTLTIKYVELQHLIKTPASESLSSPT